MVFKNLTPPLLWRTTQHATRHRPSHPTSFTKFQTHSPRPTRRSPVRRTRANVSRPDLSRVSLRTSTERLERARGASGQLDPRQPNSLKRSSLDLSAVQRSHHRITASRENAFQASARFPSPVVLPRLLKTTNSGTTWTVSYTHLTLPTKRIV